MINYPAYRCWKTFFSVQNLQSDDNSVDVIRLEQIVNLPRWL
ncbi:unnamed protein product, partial [Brassica rapa subsp. trilocularis]